MEIYSITCTIGSVPAWVQKRLGWCCSDIPLRHTHTSVTNRPGDRTIALTTWRMDWLPASGTENPPPIFTFLTFWTLICTTAARRGGRESLRALPSPSITWTLSQCSYHPKQLYFIWELSWLYQTHIHTRTVCTNTKHSLFAYLQKHTIHVNNIKHYCGLCPNTYKLEHTVLFYS